MAVPDRSTFESMYTGKPPWDIGRPQRASSRSPTGWRGGPRCGLRHGLNALHFAERAHPVLDIDFLEGPVQEARRKAQERGLDAESLQMDAPTLADLDRRYDSVIDSGLFHVFSNGDRARYVAGTAPYNQAN